VGCQDRQISPAARTQLHLLRLASDGAEHTLKDAVPALADMFHLTDAERTELLPSGQQTILNNRVAQANSDFKKAGLLCAPRRGVFIITDRGKSVLAQNPPKIDLKLLEQFPEFLTFKAESKTLSEAEDVPPTAPPVIETPLESLEVAYEKIRGELKAEALERLKAEVPKSTDQPLTYDLIDPLGLSLPVVSLRSPESSGPPNY
jgi:restriction system protein